MAMRVLLITTDLYKTIGGGQVVYKKIIESTPDVEFFYFVDIERAGGKHPQNAHPIKLLARRSLRVLVPPPFPDHRLRSFADADRYARSVAGMSFDVVDMPDYYTFGVFLRHAFAHHGVSVKCIALALHGNISTSIELNWGSTGNNVMEQRLLEEEQFRRADAVYGISPRYIHEWQSKLARTVSYIDPAFFVNAALRTPDAGSKEQRPSLYCIGRTERRKGNDLFIELVSWLRRETYERAAHIGDEDYSNNSISSGYLLKCISENRDVEVEYLPAMDQAQMSELYSGKVIIVLPVRYDSLNLVALEALFSGCPVAVSDRAGVCDYLDQYHPGLPYIKIDFDNFYSSVSSLQTLVDNYERHRQVLADYLVSYPPFPNSPLRMKDIYQKLLDGSMADTGGGRTEVLPYKGQGRSAKEKLVRWARRLLPVNTYHRIKRIVRAPGVYFAGKLKKSEYFGDAKFFAALMDAQAVPWRLAGISEHSEYNLGRLREKLNAIYGNCSNPLYRCNFWKDIARIERILGNELIAVTYELRILRLLGEDCLGYLPEVIATLEEHGFVHEASVAQAMYADPEQAEENIYRYLKETYERNKVREDKPWQFVEDYRSQRAPKVSVIVSLYKAADKLDFFLTALSQQTLVKRGDVEIILVDSGSRTTEKEVFDVFQARLPLNVVYGRSVNRETIQSAWNRGIGLAQAPYLVFLGVDEALYPEGLEVLAGELDRNLDVDWVMANSLVTEVEENGVYKNGVMTYDRTGGTKDHTYLETCYLSWVGGMYRKSIHERFGYYDETFGAAGDTEFKNRILPFINVKFVPRLLGLFFNYPDGQTTASPKAEIEDLRAWYIHRTPGGVRYAFENRPLADAEAILARSMGYRKSYCSHTSYDMEYATSVADFLGERSDFSKSIVGDLTMMQSLLCSMEFVPKWPSRLGGLFLLIKTWRMHRKLEAKHRRLVADKGIPSYKVLNDNRYEQHSWLWKSSGSLNKTD